MTECLFCKIVAGDLPCDKVYEDDLVLVFEDINPQADIHLLMVPKQHVASLDELGDEHDALIAHMMKLQPRLAKEQGLGGGFRTIINTGKDGGQVVFHLHMHLLGGPSLFTFG